MLVIPAIDLRGGRCVRGRRRQGIGVDGRLHGRLSAERLDTLTEGWR